MSALLPPSLLRQLEQCQLLAARRTKTSAKGERRSRARGHSVEFADYRNYVAGDDLRYLDWNLYGRLDRLFLKLYEEERELPVTLFLDCSESMGFGEPSKFDFARRLAAAIGYVALCSFDRVSVVPFPTTAIPPLAQAELRQVRGKRSTLRFFQNLEKLRAGGAAGIGECLRRGALQMRRTGVSIVLSDFLDPEGYQAGLKALLARGSEVTLVQVLSPEELQPSTYGDLKLVDSETGFEQELTFGKFRLQAYLQTLEQFVGELRDYAGARGAGHFMVSSSTALEDLLLRRFREAEVLG